jgi:hypothetical protein
MAGLIAPIQHGYGIGTLAVFYDPGDATLCTRRHVLPRYRPLVLDTISPLNIPAATLPG